MNLKIYKDKPEWSNVKHGKRVVIVEFPNCKFKWIPTYRQISNIMTHLVEIEEESWTKQSKERE